MKCPICEKEIGEKMIKGMDYIRCDECRTLLKVVWKDNTRELRIV